MGSCTSKSHSVQQNNVAQMNIKIWNKNQHNLFDFETKNVRQDQFHASDSGKLVQLNFKESEKEEENKQEEKKENQQQEQEHESGQEENQNEDDNDENNNSIVIQKDEQKENEIKEEKKEEKEERDDEVIHIKNNETADMPNNQIFKYEFKNNLFSIKQTPNIDAAGDQNESGLLWYVIRDQHSGQLPVDKKKKLQVGDIFKLGRASLRVQELVLNSDDNDNIPLQTEVQENLDDSVSEGDKHCCRICLGEGSSVSNPLLSPCKCNGSMKYLHLKCAQLWVKKNIKTKKYDNSPITVHFWKKLKCELCHQMFQTCIQFNDIIYDLINIEKPQGNYLTLQLLGADRKQDRGIFVITLGKKNLLKIGRTHECDIKLNDISVSRVHANLVIQNKQLYIEDCGSKFGTLIQLQDELLLDPKLRKQYLIQCGRTVVTLEFLKALKESQQIQEQKKIERQYQQSYYNINEMNIKQIEDENQLELSKKKELKQLKQCWKRKQQHLGNLMESLIDINDQEGLQRDQNGKQCIIMDNIVIYDIEDRYIKSNQKIPTQNYIMPPTQLQIN